MKMLNIIQSPILSSVFSHLCFKAPVNASVSLLLCLLLALPAFAQLPTAVQPLPSPELALRLKKLESELRCLVCQNQTLADSPAGLAGDLRREVRSLVESGKSDKEIKDFLQVRYGDFVLYKPPVDRKTWVLWFGPFVLLGGGAVIALWVGRRRRQLALELVAASPSADAKTARTKALLNEEPS